MNDSGEKRPIPAMVGSHLACGESSLLDSTSIFFDLISFERESPIRGWDLGVKSPIKLKIMVRLCVFSFFL